MKRYLALFWLVMVSMLLLSALIWSKIPNAYREYIKSIPTNISTTSNTEPKLQSGEFTNSGSLYPLAENFVGFPDESKQTNYLTIWLSNRVVVKPYEGYKGYPLIQFTDEEWKLITNYCDLRETNIQYWTFSGPTNKIPK